MTHISSRIENLRATFDRGEALSLAELAACLGGVSKRHVRRLIGKLRAEGVEVCAVREGRIKRFFVKEAHRRSYTAGFRFDEEEMLALAVAAEAAKEALRETPLEEPLRRAFGKLLDRLAPEALTFEMEDQPAHWHFGGHEVSVIDPDVFRVLQHAISECRSVRVDYHTASTGAFSKDRKIDPLQLARPGGSWMVVAWCHKRRALRDFALAGIARAVACHGDEEQAFFSPPASFDPKRYFADRFGALSGDGLRVVRLLVEADRVPYFWRKKYHPSQEVEMLSDGRAEVSFRVAGLKGIRAFVQSWGAGVTVLEPAELVERLKIDARTLAARYSRPADTVRA